MGRKPLLALTVIVLILVGVGGAVTRSYAQTNTSSTATTCPPACQEVVPILPYQAAAPVQNGALPPVYGGDGNMYVSNEGSNTVSVISAGLNAGNVTVGPAPLEGAYDPYSGLFYVPDSQANEVSILSGASLDQNIQLQASPLTPAFDPLNGYMYVPNNGGCDIGGPENGTPCGTTVTVINGAIVIANITVGTGPEEPVVDTNIHSIYYGFVYVPNAVSQDISVISGKNNTVVATIGSGPSYPVLVPSNPGGGVYDPADDTIYMGSYVIHGIDVIGELPVLSMPNLVIQANEAPPQFQVQCTASCVYDPYNGLVYEPSDPNQPFFGGFIIINGTDATASSCDDCGAPEATFNPVNGWVYMADEVISGTTPFALASPISGAAAGAQSYDPDLGGIYGISGGPAGGDYAVLLGNRCPAVGGQYNYSALDLQLCNEGGSSITPTINNVTATSAGGVNGSGTHIFSIVTSGNIPMAAGNWSASGSKIVGQAGGAVISFSLTGQNGTHGFATIKVLKSEIVFLLGATALAGASGPLPTSRSIASWLPQLYIDGQLVTDATVTQDSTYVYLTFPIHFSTHQVELEWIPSADAIGTSNSTSGTSSGSSSVSASENTSLSSSTSNSQGPSSSSSSNSASLNLALSSNYIVLFGVSTVVMLLVAAASAKLKRFQDGHRQEAGLGVPLL